MTASGYVPSATLPTDSTGYVDMRCTCSGVLDCIAFSYTLEIQAGSYGTVSQRKMKHTTRSETMNYGLYKDLTRTQPFDIGTHGVTNLYLLGLFGSSQRTYVYGRIPAGQTLPAGTYKDAPVVSISY